MFFDKISLSCVLAMLAGILFSCSNLQSNPTSDPTSPQSDAAVTTNASVAQDNHYLWAFYQVKYDPADNSVELTPVRDTAIHWNVLKFLEQGVCKNCVKVMSVAPGPYGTKKFGVGITHPFSSKNLTGFDVRGIAIFHGTQIFPIAGLTLPDRNQGDGELYNADGYTTLYNSGTAGSGPGGLQGYLKGKFAGSTVPNATLNGYKRYISSPAANTRNAFYAGDGILASYVLDMPDTQFIFGYAVDASWAPPSVKPVTNPMTDFPPEANCSEPWKVGVTDNPVGTGLTDQGGSATITIDVYDWQGKDSYFAPTVECPDLFDGVATATFKQNLADHTQWEATITNTKLPPVGPYRCLVKIVDKDNLTAPSWLDLTAYQVHIVTVVESGWARIWGGADFEQGYGVVEDGSGNVYVAGYFGGISVDFNPDPTAVEPHSSNGAFDVFLSKFDSSGALVWTRTWGGSDWDIGNDVAVDGSGNVYVTGYFKSPSVDFDPGTSEDSHSSKGDEDIFLSKFDSSGTFVWARTWGGKWFDNGNGVDVDVSGNVYVTGYFNDLVDFDPGPADDPHTSNGFYDSFVSKFDSSGTFVWARTWGGNDVDEGLDVDVDGSGNVYVTGDFQGTVDFDPDPTADDLHTASGATDIFLSKFDSSGTFAWARTWGGSLISLGEQGDGVAVDGSGNVYVTGFFAGGVDFDPGTPVDPHVSNGIVDIFVSKFDSSGTFVWARTWGGGDEDVGNGVAVDGSGNVYVTGYFKSASVDFNPDLTADDPHLSNGFTDTFLSKFDSSGTFVWARTWGGGGADDGNDITVGGSGNVYVTGYFGGTSVDFNPDPLAVDPHSSNGNYDVFLSKFRPDGLW
jgi:hypothetical protein